MRRRNAALQLAAALTALIAVVVGCENAPFDPSSLANHRPVARIFVSSLGGGQLNPTSYYHRTFHWSGSDEDGSVVMYYVTIETEDGVPAPWDTTTATDTTMTFTTDDAGNAQALIRVACRDNRGALSDTVSQFIPLRNFPPVINFVADFDTVNWSYSSVNFRCFALDLDGAETMDDSIVYYLDTADAGLPPAPYGDSAANPAERPVRKRIDDLSTGEFSVDLHGVAAPGERTLHIEVGDEANAVTEFDWSWEVLPALSNVLLVDDLPGSLDNAVYHASMDSMYGPGQWSLYDMSNGLPDRPWVFKETLRQFDAVFWYTSAQASRNLAGSTATLREYLYPTDAGAEPGRLLLIAKGMIGLPNGPSPSFLREVLGMNSTATQPTFAIPSGKICYGIRPGLPDLTFPNNYTTAVGIEALPGAEPVYQMEYYRLWSPQGRPPYDPYVGVRNPDAITSEYARSVALTIQYEYLSPDVALASLRALLQDELGVSLP